MIVARYDTNNYWRYRHNKFGPLSYRATGDKELTEAANAALYEVGGRVIGRRPLAGLAVFDVGCGNGFYRPDFERAGASWYGVDIAGPYAHKHGDITQPEFAVADWPPFDVLALIDVEQHIVHADLWRGMVANIKTLDPPQILITLGGAEPGRRRPAPHCKRREPYEYIRLFADYRYTVHPFRDKRLFHFIKS